MGQDLIVRMVIGPKTLPGDPDLVKKATEHGAKIIAIAKKYCELEEQTKEDPQFPDDVFNAMLKEISDLKGYAEDEQDCMELIELDPAMVVNDLLATWNCPPRDCCWRELPSKADRIIFVTGEMSWGSEPENDSYRTLLDAGRLGIFQFFELG